MIHYILMNTIFWDFRNSRQDANWSVVIQVVSGPDLKIVKICKSKQHYKIKKGEIVFFDG